MTKPNRSKVFQYIAGTIKRKNCRVYIVNGVEDHLHIITHLHPSVTLSGLVKDVKISSSKFIKQNNLFPAFRNWQIGYSAFTYSTEAIDNLIRYVETRKGTIKKILYKGIAGTST